MKRVLTRFMTQLVAEWNHRDEPPSDPLLPLLKQRKRFTRLEHALIDRLELANEAVRFATEARTAQQRRLDWWEKNYGSHPADGC